MDPLSTPAVISALPTPFDAGLGIDLEAYRELLERLPEQHRTVLVAGTTGEFPALTDPERVELFTAAAQLLGPDQVIAHVGAASLGQAVALAEAAAGLGISSVALLTPYYLPADDRQVVDFFGEFAERQPAMATYVYVFPERTGTRVSPPAMAELAALPDVVGVKLSGAANDLLDRYRESLRHTQSLYSGDDRQVLRIGSRGGTGVISGCFPVLPAPFVDGLTHPDDPDAQARIERVVDVLGPSIARQKLALQQQTSRPWRSRMSMPRITETTRRDVLALLQEAGGLEVSTR